jgi:tRNA(fMet)-specific endonuclease VapC
LIYLLDTDHLSLLERGGAESLRLQMRLDPIPAGEIATTIITYEEQMRGWMARIAQAKMMGQQLKSPC